MGQEKAEWLIKPVNDGLLLTLAAHPGRVYSRDQILRLIWGDEYEGTTRTVDNFVCSLRAKVEPDPGKPRHIVTVRGLGYRLEK